MTVHIKRLELHGFKSFPRSTVFEFDSGITAIIGPNGSGKSNIADAMRWVLGEQSYSNLRGRKAEDVIFSGSSARAAVGMAEVTVTLDNSSGELPIEYQEVNITRRAYRSGENQYLINGARVRLKDITHLTSALGQTHTVIGQGLVDAALSQRPDERRGLFEHAAGITGLRLKYSATERHLAETTANSTRLEDLLTELEPRLKTLERQAKQAREYADVQQELRETTLRYYASLWRTHQEQLHELQQMAAQTDGDFQQASRQLESVQASVQQQTQKLESLQERSETLDRTVAHHRSQLREIEHRIDLTRQRRDTFAAEIDRFDERHTALVQELEQVTEQIGTLREEECTVEGQITDLDEEIARQQSARATLETEMISLTTQRDEIDSEREALRQRMYRAQAEQEYRRQQQNDLQERATSISLRRRELEQELVEIDELCQKRAGARDELARALDTCQTDISHLESDLASRQQRIRKLREELETVEGEHARRSARYDALQRLRESGEGLHRGVQAVLDAAKSGALDGVAGTLASQITVPEHLENAIEAALGGHLQDIIVQRWVDAEAAIDLLKKRNAGRATFQPLDTQRRSRNQSRPSIHGDAGVHGFAVDLIEFDSDLDPVLEGLLGRTVITDDLPSTRRILGKLRGGWTVVTLDGEVTRAGGSVTGGSRVRQSGTLGRERELRQLPAEIKQLDSRRSALQSDIQQVAAEIADHESQLDQTRQESRRIEHEVDAAARELATLEHQREQSRQALENLESETTTAAAEADTRTQELEQIAEQYQRDSEALAALDQQREEIGHQIEQIQASTDDDDLRQLDRERSRLGERLHSITRQISSLNQREEQLQQDISRTGHDRETTCQTIEQLETELRDLTSQVEQSRHEIDTLSGDIEPLSTQRSALRHQLVEQQQNERQLQNQQRELERRRDAQRFDIEREQAQGDHLLERVTDILEIENPAPLLEQQPVEDDLDMQKLDTRLHRLRQRARRIGAFGEDTIAQYEQEQERFTFLRGQLDDVQRGAEALQTMLRDLDRAMSEEFDRTFGMVAQAFQMTFQRLFGGGSAQLIRSDDDERVGIDIVAQPPGKKLQSLALLSGGERALTAVALLFAIQRVNPSPFCLLDEVDAALDEANVVRFRDELRDLAANTQFVVVTHNRATIEGADVLYGITMGTDAVSRVVSMKLPDEAPVAAS